MLLTRICVLLFVINSGISFGQDFTGPDSKWIFNSEPNGIIEISYEKDTILNEETFSKYIKTINRLVDQDTVLFEIGSIYMRDDSGIVKYSNDGIYIDTLFNFISEIGDKWKIFEDSTLVDSIEIEVLDVFMTTINNIELKSQSLLYRRFVGDNERTFVDTIYEYIGAKYVYLEPFDLEEGSPEGGVLRCFTNDLIGTVDPNNRFTLGADLYSMFEYECGETSSLNLDESTEVLIYPNPAHSTLTIELKSHLNSFIQVIDIRGKVCLEKNISQYSSIDISVLDSGIYYLRINGTNTFKFIKLD